MAESDLINPQTPTVNILFGPPKAGKSVLLKRLLYDKCINGYYKNIIVFTPTKFNEAYNFLDDKNVFQDYKEEILVKYLQNLENYYRKTKKKPPPNCIVFDDTLGKLNGDTSTFTNFLTTHRHYNCSVYICTQYIQKGVCTVFRSVATHLFCFHSMYEPSLKCIYEIIGGDSKFREFKTFFKQITREPYHALVFVAGQRTMKDSYFDLICEIAPEFKLNFLNNKQQ